MVVVIMIEVICWMVVVMSDGGRNCALGVGWW